MNSIYKNILLIINIIFISPFFIFSQTNMDFEIWGPSLINSDYEPVDWGTLNADLTIFFPNTLITSTYQEISNPGQGFSSVKLITKSGYNNTFYSNVFGKDTLGGIVTLGYTPYLGVPLGVPYTQKPTSVDLMYKSNIISGDTGFFLIQVTHWDGSQRVIDGDAVMLFTGNINSWTSLSLPLTYYTTDTPDTLVIIASSSSSPWLDNIGGPSPNPLPGSELEIDAISLSTSGSCPSPIAYFTHMALGSSVAFFDSSSTTGSTTYNWDFGDGLGTSFLPSPIYFYASPGTYNVCLIITDSCGSDTACQNVIISGTGCPPPISLFSYTTNWLNASFTDLSSTSGSTSYSWDFGDGIGFSNLQNPSYSYLSFGLYTACLTVSDSCDTNSFCLPVTVFDSLSNIYQINLNEELSIYPNPGDEKINILLNYEMNSSNIIIHNYLGAIIKRLEFESSFIELNTSDFTNGIYSFTIFTDNYKSTSGFFIIQHN